MVRSAITDEQTIAAPEDANQNSQGDVTEIEEGEVADPHQAQCNNCEELKGKLCQYQK